MHLLLVASSGHDPRTPRLVKIPLLDVQLQFPCKASGAPAKAAGRATGTASRLHDGGKQLAVHRINHIDFCSILS